MSKTYLPYDPDQQLLLPAALREWLPPGYLAYFISDVVDQLDPRFREGRLSRRSRRVTSRKGVLCQRAGMVKLGHVALDGAKVRANASRHQAMSYRRMKEKEAQLAAEVAELLRRAQEVDEAEEDRRYVQDRRGDELPEELSFREGRLGKIREAMAALEAEAEAACRAGGSRG